MPVAPFAPVIASGIGALFGSRDSGPKAAGGQSLSADQTALMQSQTRSADQATSLSKYLQKQAQYSAPAFGRAMGYYSTLLNGNRGAMQQAVAPEAAGITDAAKGATMNLERLGVTGGQKVQAQADLARQTGGQLGQLTVGLRPQAANALGNMGAQGMGFAGQALQGLTGAGSIYANALKQTTDIANTQYDRNKQTGASLAGLIMPTLNAWASFRKGDQVNKGGTNTSGGWNPEMG